MKNFNEDPLDLLDDDNDAVIEMCTILDDRKNKEQSGQPPSGNSGCCIILMAMGTSLLVAGWGVTKFIV